MVLRQASEKEMETAPLKKCVHMLNQNLLSSQTRIRFATLRRAVSFYWRIRVPGQGDQVCVAVLISCSPSENGQGVHDYPHTSVRHRPGPRADILG